MPGKQNAVEPSISLKSDLGAGTDAKRTWTFGLLIVARDPPMEMHFSLLSSQLSLKVDRK